MSVVAPAERDEGAALERLRELADLMFSRAAGAPLINGNQVRLLEDDRENYPAWLAAIRAAKHHVHFENYFIQDDEIGQEFSEAFVAKALLWRGIQLRQRAKQGRPPEADSAGRELVQSRGGEP